MATHIPSWEQLQQLLRPGHSSAAASSRSDGAPCNSTWEAWPEAPTELSLWEQMAACENHGHPEGGELEEDQDLAQMAEFFGIDQPGGLD